MKPFTYERAADPGDAVAKVAGRPGAVYLAGGTNLVDHLKLGVATPGRPRRRQPAASRRRDVARRRRPADRCRGAQRRPGRPPRRTAAATPCSRRRCSPGASGQIRNAATTARQPAAADPLRLLPGRHHPVQQAGARVRLLGTRAGSSAATRSSGPPSTASPPTPPTWRWRWPRSTRWSWCWARDGERRVPMGELHRLPGDEPQHDTTLQQGDLVTAVEVPALPFASRSAYRKVRDRASYAFALVSVAAALDVEDGTVRDVRHRPGWRRAQAVAGDRRGGAAARRRPPRRRSGRRPRPSWRRLRRCPATGSRSRWPATRSPPRCATWPEAPDDADRHPCPRSAGRSRASTARPRSSGWRSTPSSRSWTTRPTCTRSSRPSPAAAILEVDASAAEALDGVLLVLTHLNAPQLADTSDREYAVLQSADVAFRGSWSAPSSPRPRRPPGTPPSWCGSPTSSTSTTPSCARTTPTSTSRTRSTRRTRPTPMRVPSSRRSPRPRWSSTTGTPRRWSTTTRSNRTPASRCGRTGRGSPSTTRPRARTA